MECDKIDTINNIYIHFYKYIQVKQTSSRYTEQRSTLQNNSKEKMNTYPAVVIIFDLNNCYHPASFFLHQLLEA